MDYVTHFIAHLQTIISGLLQYWRKLDAAPDNDVDKDYDLMFFLLDDSNASSEV